jgi:hypothetical protein
MFQANELEETIPGGGLPEPAPSVTLAPQVSLVLLTARAATPP